MCRTMGARVSYLLWCNVKPHTVCSYGIVWQGRWKHKSGHKTVAVKVLKAASIDECPDEFAQEDFRKEVATLKAIRYRTSQSLSLFSSGHRPHHPSNIILCMFSHLQASTRTFNSTRPPSSALTLTRPSCSLVACCVVCHPTCSHSCLLQFHGFGVNSSGQGFVVTEFCEQGSLRSVLKNTSIELQWAVRTRIALEVRNPVTNACDNTSDP
jgi:serine/threonine protein kinase